MKGHRFRPVAFTTTKYCGQCNRVIWGIGKNAYQCQGWTSFKVTNNNATTLKIYCLLRFSYLLN